MNPYEYLLLFLLLDGVLLKVALQVPIEDYDADMPLYWREEDIHAKIIALLPDEFKGAVVLDVQEIDSIVVKPSSPASGN